MPSTIRKVSYVYVTAASKPGEAARILQALRDANVNLLAFSGFPQGRNKAQIDVVVASIGINQLRPSISSPCPA